MQLLTLSFYSSIPVNPPPPFLFNYSPSLSIHANLNSFIVQLHDARTEAFYIYIYSPGIDANYNVSAIQFGSTSS